MATKKDYEAIAGIIKDLSDTVGKIDKDNLVKNLSDYFEGNNPNFDSDKFYKACYGDKIMAGKTLLPLFMKKNLPFPAGVVKPRSAAEIIIAVSHCSDAQELLRAKHKKIPLEIDEAKKLLVVAFRKIYKEPVEAVK